jgi:Putative transmembrane protein (PGPGW)
LKRVATAVLGGLLTIIGIVLLVLPGPGFVVIALGLAVLAREFTWAKRPLDYAMKRADDGLNQVARSWGYATLDAVAGLVLIAVGVLDFVVGLPIIELVGDIFVIPSGLFLIGTVFYARRRGPRGQQPVHSLDGG